MIAKNDMVEEEQARFETLQNLLLDEERMAGMIPGALQKAVRENEEAMAVTLGQPVATNVRRILQDNPEEVMEALWPTLLPAMRNMVKQSVQELIDNLQVMMDRSLSLEGWKWRIESWRTGTPVSEIALRDNTLYQVEQVFLIHADSGLLIEHLDSSGTAEDPDLVSGMLSAIQSFVQDSFNPDEGAGINKLRIGGLEILVERSRDLLLAAVIRGSSLSELQTTLRRAVNQMQRKYAHVLVEYSGDSEDIPDEVSRDLAGCMVTKVGDRKSNPYTPLVVAALATFVFLLSMSWLAMKIHRGILLEDLRDTRSQPGALVVDIEERDGRFHVFGSHDPRFFDPEAFLHEREIPKNKVVWHLGRHASLSPPAGDDAPSLRSGFGRPVPAPDGTGE